MLNSNLQTAVTFFYQNPVVSLYTTLRWLWTMIIALH